MFLCKIYKNTKMFLPKLYKNTNFRLRMIPKKSCNPKQKKSSPQAAFSLWFMVC